MIRQRYCWHAHQISQQTEHSKKSISRLLDFAIFDDNMSHQGLKLFPGSHAFRAHSTLTLSKEIRTRLSTSGTVLYGVHTWGWHLWQLSCNIFYINWYSDQNKKNKQAKKQKNIQTMISIVFNVFQNIVTKITTEELFVQLLTRANNNWIP